MRAYRHVQNEGFGVSRFLSGPFFDGLILFVCQHPKMPSAGKISVQQPPKFMPLVILSTTFSISPFWPTRRNDFGKRELMRLGQFSWAVAPIGARNRFWLTFFAGSDRNFPICF